MSSDGPVGGLPRTLGAAAPASVLLVGIGGLHDLRHRVGWDVAERLLDDLAERVRTSLDPDAEVLRPELGTLLVVRPGTLDEAALHSSAAELVGSMIATDASPSLLLRAQLGVAAGTLAADDDPMELLADLSGAADEARTRHDHIHVLDSADREERVKARSYRRELPGAIAAGQLQLWYQPKVDLRDGRLIGFEALARWPDDSGGFRSPATFVPILEESEAIVPFGRWAIDRAVADLAEWDRRGANPELGVSVNLSARQLVLDDVPATVARATARTAIDPSRLTLELTETAVLEEISAASSHLGALRDAGAVVSLDDFGTGFSSLSLLRRLPFDEVKIDRSFVRELGHERGDTALVEGLVSLAHRLGRRIVAEGVETREQLAVLLANGCDEAQGYLFARPAPPQEAMAIATEPADFDDAVLELVRTAE